MKYFSWNNVKNEKLKSERGISFEDVVFHVERGDILDMLEHANQERYAGQRVIMVNVEGCVYLVPCVDEGDTTVLKTVIPSRKASKKIPAGGCGQ